MTRTWSLAVAWLGTVACAATRVEDASSGEPGRPESFLSVQLGARSLDDEVAWEDIDTPVVLGFEGGSIGEPLGFEVGVSFAADQTTELGVDVTDSFVEISAGGRATFGDERWMPYVGLGLALVAVDVEGESGGFSTSDDDASVGFYGHGGVLLRVGERFWLGADARLLTGTEVDLFGIETDADYGQLVLVLLWGK